MTLLHFLRRIPRGSITPWQATVTATTLLHFLRRILRGSITPWQATVMATTLLHFLRWIPCGSSTLWQVATMDAASLPATDSTWQIMAMTTIPSHYSL